MTAVGGEGNALYPVLCSCCLLSLLQDVTEKIEQHKDIIDANNKSFYEMKKAKDAKQNERKYVHCSLLYVYVFFFVRLPYFVSKISYNSSVLVQLYLCLEYSYFLQSDILALYCVTYATLQLTSRLSDMYIYIKWSAQVQYNYNNITEILLYCSSPLSTVQENKHAKTKYKSNKVDNLKKAKQNHHSSVASYDTRPGNEVGSL